MTFKRVDPSALGEYVGRYVEIVSDFGWDMNGWPDWGILQGVDDGYVYIQDDRDDEEYEDFHDVGGTSIAYIKVAMVRY